MLKLIVVPIERSPPVIGPKTGDAGRHALVVSLRRRRECFAPETHQEPVFLFRDLFAALGCEGWLIFWLSHSCSPCQAWDARLIMTSIPIAISLVLSIYSIVITLDL